MSGRRVSLRDRRATEPLTPVTMEARDTPCLYHNGLPTIPSLRFPLFSHKSP